MFNKNNDKEKLKKLHDFWASGAMPYLESNPSAEIVHYEYSIPTNDKSISAYDYLISNGQILYINGATWEVYHVDKIKNKKDTEYGAYSNVVGAKVSIQRIHSDSRLSSEHFSEAEFKYNSILDNFFGELKVGSHLVHSSYGYEFVVERIYVDFVLNRKATDNTKKNPFGDDIKDPILMVSGKKHSKHSDSPSDMTIDIGMLRKEWYLITDDMGITKDGLLSLVVGKINGNTVKSLMPVADADDAEGTEVMSTSNTEYLKSKLAAANRAANTGNLIKFATNTHIEAVKNDIMGRIAGVMAQVDILKKEIKRLNKVIAIIELWAGIKTEITHIQEGSTAPAEDVLNLRQLVLYMDEEVGDPKDNGIDFRRVNDFDEWLLSDDNINIVAPESKCIVVFRPRRRSKVYSDDPFINTFMNSQNDFTYVLMRNGDNIYRIYDENINIHTTLFPKRDELTSLYEKLDDNSSYTREKAEDGLFVYQKNIMLIHGILTHSGIYGFDHGINIYDLSTHDGRLKYIYDAEDTITDGTPSWDQYLKSINEDIEVGSRIYFSYDAMVNYYGNSKEFVKDRSPIYYSHDSSVPPGPRSGIYVVKRNKSGDLCISYNPKDKIWDNDKGYHTRMVPLQVTISKSDKFILNYDRLEIGPLEYYTKDRVNRPKYYYMLPVIWGIIRKLKKEFVWEDATKDMLISKFVSADYTDDARILLQSIFDDYKFEVKWKRPINRDDMKSLRIITTRFVNALYDIGHLSHTSPIRSKITSYADHVLQCNIGGKVYFGIGYSLKEFAAQISDYHEYSVSKKSIYNSINLCLDTIMMEIANKYPNDIHLK